MARNFAVDTCDIIGTAQRVRNVQFTHPDLKEQTVIRDTDKGTSQDNAVCEPLRASVPP